MSNAPQRAAELAADAKKIYSTLSRSNVIIPAHVFIAGLLLLVLLGIRSNDAAIVFGIAILLVGVALTVDAVAALPEGL